MTLTRFETEVAPHDILTWLSSQNDPFKCYWRSRDGEFEAAGIGQENVFCGRGNVPISDIQDCLRSIKTDGHALPRVYGGSRFSINTTQSDEWASFQDYYWVLPKLELRREGERYCLIQTAKTSPPAPFSTPPGFAVPLSRGESHTPPFQLRQGFVGQVGHPSHTPRPSGTPLERGINSPSQKGWMTDRSDGVVFTPIYPQWKIQVENVLSQIRENAFQKIVLARQAKWELSAPVSGIELLKNMSPQGCFQFYFSNSEAAFLGSTPELLYERHGHSLTTEALAGTRPLGEPFNQKDTEEHAWVVTAIKAILSDVCDTLQQDPEISIAQLATLQHLRFMFHAQLRTTSDDTLLQLLHPTPAVAGFPKQASLDYLAKTESFDRGFYAGPVGWIEADSACFAVAIRSALLTQNALFGYSGAGIVKGSDSQAEWEELDLKIGGLLGSHATHST